MQLTGWKQLLITLFFKMNFNFSITISWNGYENRVSWPHLPVVCHQACSIWLMQKLRPPNTGLLWPQFHFWGRSLTHTISEDVFVTNSLIGQEIGIQPIKAQVSYDRFINWRETYIDGAILRIWSESAIYMQQILMRYFQNWTFYDEYLEFVTFWKLNWQIFFGEC